VKPDWFSAGTYTKEFKQGERTIQQWNVKGRNSNIYEAVKETGHPNRIYQEPLSDMTFDLNTYSEAFEENEFELPSSDQLGGGSCANKCPALTICSFVQ